jgi:hypothetical protein
MEAAKQIVNARIEEFEKRFLQRFADGGDGQSEALADPDFLYMVKESQHAYLRSGDEGVRETLIDLIARRSRENKRNRLSLTLNDAVQKSAVLTSNEFAELSLCYLLKSVVHNRLGNMKEFADFYGKTLVPLLPDISREAASYQYLEAQSCATISAIGSTNVVGIFRSKYPGLFSQGFTKEQAENCFPKGRKQLVEETGLLLQCLNDATKLQVACLNKTQLEAFAKDKGLTEAESSAIGALIDSTTLNGEDLVAHIEKHVPEVRQLIDLWNKTLLHRMNLTTVGIAIGHSNLVRLCKWDADLSIWIR